MTLNDYLVLKNRILIRKVLVATGISIILFVLLTILSYFLNLEYRVNFKIGLPWTFYYQFLVDGEVQHGTNPMNFIKDAFVTWSFSTILWLILKRKK
ncbi:MAG: hypothetical protein UR43_C0010G0035 [candidate division TM6 bacterium GW2011_GWF2_33_332]|nr:MAG: hypothetical protein UR43_C0010G0035 [candidate division TM6 bacterium GW2011_GWF2_33_332]